jgi:hypothetical protein
VGPRARGQQQRSHTSTRRQPLPAHTPVAARARLWCARQQLPPCVSPGRAHSRAGARVATNCPRLACPPANTHTHTHTHAHTHTHTHTHTHKRRTGSSSDRHRGHHRAEAAQSERQLGPGHMERRRVQRVPAGQDRQRRKHVRVLRACGGACCQCVCLRACVCVRVCVCVCVS